MFTGIIETQGTISQIQPDALGITITIEAETIAQEVDIGASVAVNGACLTVVNRDARSFSANIVEETMRRTTFEHLEVHDLVNLERTMRLSDRLDGHIVQGHVDGIGKIVGKESRGNSIWYTLEIPVSLMPYLIEKGSIALDGISLTIADLTDNMCAVTIIPHTAEVTTFGTKKTGDLVNIEVDLIGKYVESLLKAGRIPTNDKEEITGNNRK